MKRLRIKQRVACALAVLAVLALKTTVPVEAATTLDPTNTANFKQDGTQPITPASVLLFDDQSVSDFCV